MRTSLLLVLIALRFLFEPGTARSDTLFHLPCDPEGGVSIGNGIFRGRTRTTSVGDIEFERVIIGATRLELTVFENCGPNGEDRPTVTRWWLGRLNVFGSIATEQAELSLRNPSLGAARGTPGENALLKADLDGGTSLSYGLGARASLLDATHFHVEAYYEQTGTIGWQGTKIETLVARVRGVDLDITELVNALAAAEYRFQTRAYGVTIGVPMKAPGSPKLRLTPFLTLGRMSISADIAARMEPSFVDVLGAFGADAESIARPRSVRKTSWSANGGARLDVNEHLSFEASVAYGKTPSSRVYIGMLTMTVRFRTPTLLDLGRARIPTDGIPF